jgi:transposase
MNPIIRPRRDFEALESRRLQAVEIFKQSHPHPQAEVFRLLKVSRQTASRWYEAWRDRGAVALKAAGRAGRKPRLDQKVLRQVEKALLQGPKVHGFSTELWTLDRVAAVIRRTSGVEYHPGHVWRVLKRLGWSRQRPMRRAKEKDSAATAQWLKQRWPQLKKTPKNAMPG